MALLTLSELGLESQHAEAIALIDEFSEVRECAYKGEHYSVRDNGAVLRHSKADKKPRPLDDIWTFGKRNETNAYMYIGTHRVHIICAIAFHGERDSKAFVVDHIDTNRCNNRKDNLRWLTRLENALNNPITRKRIEWLCGGDIQKFIDNPACLRVTGQYPDIEWMRTVTAEEARNAKENLERWAKKPFLKPMSEHPKSEVVRDKEWMYKKPPEAGDKTRGELAARAQAWKKYRESQQAIVQTVNSEPETPDYVQALSPQVAVQVCWNTPSEFPCCPDVISEDTIARYAEALKEDVVFCRNSWWESKVIKAILINDGSRIAVASASPEGMKIAIAIIYIENAKIVHETYGTYFMMDGVEKALCELQGLQWTGGDVFDDYC